VTLLRRLLVLAVSVVLAACTSASSTTSTTPQQSSAVVQGRPVVQVYSPNDQVDLTCEADACTASDLAARTVTLAGDVGSKYRLGPTFFTEEQVASASAMSAADPSEWVVLVTLDADGSRGLLAATKQALQQSPEARIAIVVNGRVDGAPVVHSKITSGLLQLSGFTQQEAQDLANQLNA
jgi:preprotein translocase subunit SecD